ncbi:MAG: ThuA domain-containing protein [Clostridia bacterium]|nr:ThuA domain-containing protein [Clostridia bacterium]
MIKVTVWNEGLHEKLSKTVAGIYPAGIHNCIKSFLSSQEDIVVRTATLSDKKCGLSDEVLDDTDVLIWWGHMAHEKVPDKIAAKVAQRVLDGMGFIALHSAHYSKPFKLLMGTSCSLNWREGDRERLWTVNPSHPIAKGVPPFINIPVEEMYGERFDIPEPEQLVFIGWFAGGEVFRSGCCWQRGLGRVFYFQPGHETNPTYHDENIQRIIINAVRWAAPCRKVFNVPTGHSKISPEERLHEADAKKH